MDSERKKQAQQIVWRSTQKWKDAKAEEGNAVNFGRRKAVNRHHDASAEHILPTIRVENSGISVQTGQLEWDTRPQDVWKVLGKHW